MSGIFAITVQEARGFVAIPADIDRLAIVMGCASGLPAVAAGLKAATATAASPVTLTPADLLAAGVSALSANPRELTFTTAGATPSDAPANVVIVGLVAAANGTTSLGGETLTLSQTAGSVTTINRYKTVVTLSYPAADGTGAMITIGYGDGEGLSPFFLSGAAAVTAVGYGDGPDALTQIIEQRQSNGVGTKYPAAFYTVPADTAGAYGTIVLSGVVGTALVANDTSQSPFGTYNAQVRVIDDGNDGDGTELGTSGILYQWRLGDDGAWSNTTALGTSYSIAIPNSGTGFILGPPAEQVTAFIAAAVEARADTLAHLANAVAHDAADTSAAQIALAASSVPTTEAQAWAVLNLCRTAFASHLQNITAHNGPDPVNVVSHVEATSVQTGIALFAEYRTDFNAHLGIALAAAPAGLMAATASVAAPVVQTTADLLNAGEALLAVYPRRLTFTTAGVTPADAPASVDIVGTVGGVPVTETLNLAQTATMVTSVNAYQEITSLTYPAADGTAATIAIGYGMGVHNSADATNPIAATAPTHGTLFTGDTWNVRTLAPVPGAADVTWAFTALAASSAEHALVVLEFPLTPALAAVVSTGLNALAALGRDVTCLTRYRLPNFEANETEAAWGAAFASEFGAGVSDSRILIRATYHMITDAMTSRQYLRSDIAQFAADVVRVGRAEWPCAPADRPVPNSSLIDATGATIGHDEGPQGSFTGLSNDTLGNRGACVQRLPIAAIRQNIYNTVPWVLYASDERIRTLMVRRLANAMKRVAKAAGVPKLGARLFYTSTGPTSGVLTPSSRASVHGSIYQALQSEFGSEIDNATEAALDTGLVQVNPAVAVAPGKLLTVDVTLAPRVGGYVLELEFTLAIQE